jgi:hypothetical protein
MARESRTPQPTDAERFAEMAREIEAPDELNDLAQAFERVVRTASEAATRPRGVAPDSKKALKSESERPR